MMSRALYFINHLFTQDVQNTIQTWEDGDDIPSNLRRFASETNKKRKSENGTRNRRNKTQNVLQRGRENVVWALSAGQPA